MLKKSSFLYFYLIELFKNTITNQKNNITDYILKIHCSIYVYYLITYIKFLKIFNDKLLDLIEHIYFELKSIYSDAIDILDEICSITLELKYEITYAYNCMISKIKIDIEKFFSHLIYRIIINFISTKNMVFLKLILKIKNIDNIFKKGNINQNNTLHVSVANAIYNVVKLLIQYPNINVNLQNNQGDTPLNCTVIYNKNIEKSKLLLQHPNIDVNIQNKEGDTPLHWAVIYKNIEASKLLLKHPNIDVNIKNKDGDTPLHWSLLSDKIEIIKLLLQHKNIDVNIQNDKGNTPLHSALIDNKEIEILKLFLKHPKINLNKKNSIGSSIFYEISTKRNKELLEFILKEDKIKIDNILDNIQLLTTIDNKFIKYIIDKYLKNKKKIKQLFLFTYK